MTAAVHSPMVHVYAYLSQCSRGQDELSLGLPFVASVLLVVAVLQLELP